MTDYKSLKVFRKSQINGLTKHLGGLRFLDIQDYSNAFEKGIKVDVNERMISRAKELGLDIDYNDSNLPGEKFTFTNPRKITKEQTQYGKAWLKNHFFKANGDKRSGKNTEFVSDEVLRIAKNVSRFEFVGVLGVANSYWVINQFLPIYRTYDAKGNYFDYSPVHWGQPVIMEG